MAEFPLDQIENARLHPLAPPADDTLLTAFLRHFGITQAERTDSPFALLRQVSQAFSALPYENLTKIIRDADEGQPERARRCPAEVWADHARLGTGGTCFSLTALLLHLVRSLGFEAQPILADRRYGPDTHCALVVSIAGQPHLLDPGYLIVDPLPLDAARRTTRLVTPFNELLLAGPQDAAKHGVAAGLPPERLDLSTVQSTAQGGRSTYRLTYKLAAVDAAEFLQAWDASFDWEMMHYPLLTRVSGGRQLYLRGRHLQSRGTDDVAREELPDEALVRRINAEFGIAPTVVKRALEILALRHAPRGASHG